MKIRKQVRALYKKLVLEATAALQAHNDCTPFIDSAKRCMLCALLRYRKIFAAIHLAREKAFHMEWFESEKNLYDLLGQKMFFNKIEIELKEVANYPRKECPNCRKISTFFIPFKKLARQQGSKEGECSNCEASIDLNEIHSLPPSKEKKYKFKEDQAPRIKLRSGRVLTSAGHNEAPKTLETIGEEILREAEAQDNPPFDGSSPEIIALARNLLSAGTVQVHGERVIYDNRVIDPADTVEITIEGPIDNLHYNIRPKIFIQLASDIVATFRPSTYAAIPNGMNQFTASLEAPLPYPNPPIRGGDSLTGSTGGGNGEGGFVQWTNAPSYSPEPLLHNGLPMHPEGALLEPEITQDSDLEYEINPEPDFLPPI